MKRTLFALLLAACSSNVERPSPTPPPPWGVAISGGTMMISRDGKLAIIADPDRDRIVTVDLAKKDVVGEIALEPGDEPGRLVEDGAGRIHVALRHGGALFTMASPTATTGLRRTACGEPRGLAWQASTDLVHVACTGGELVSFAATGEAVRTLRLERDLRDVLVRGDHLVVSRFRTAELLTIDASGAVIDRDASPIVKRSTSPQRSDCLNCGADSMPVIVDAIPAVAWRTVALPDGAMLVSHQRQVKGEMKSEPGGYDQGCGGGPVEHAVTVMRAGQPPFAVERLISGALPVDVAVAPSGTKVAFAMAGSRLVHEVPMSSLSRPDREEDDDCGSRPEELRPVGFDLGAPTSIAYAPNDALVIYYPESPALVVGTEIIKLTGEVGYDSGRAMFHAATVSGLACASCHPEARDDGLVWDFTSIGPRRTQNVSGGILARAPFHWNGDMANLDQLMTEVFALRMSGQSTTSARTSLGPWLDRIPAPKGVITDPAAVTRGQQLFDAVDVGCATCHSGAQLTNNQLFDVGRGRIKVPSLLGVGARAPFMHDGCASTLLDRFGVCGGGDAHGKTSQLNAAQLADLVAYLESL
ncbi:MAG: c-type cytochrome [Myxococcota bacterium]|nr:c-type cytochrome [Myxococcota bacterium]